MVTTSFSTAYNDMYETHGDNIFAYLGAEKVFDDQNGDAYGIFNLSNAWLFIVS